MTQALLNNLNINSDSSFIKNDKSAKTDIADFAKIFDSKTSAQESDVQPITKSNDNNTTINTIGSLKSDLISDEVYQTEFNKAIQESAANIIVDDVISKINVVEDLSTEDSNTECISTEDISAEDEIINIDGDINLTTEIIKEAIITEEDSTMYNELNTLENPTVAIMLHSQIQTVVKNQVSNNNEENTGDGNITLAARTNDNSQDNTNLFKQFDNTSTKEVTSNIPKEDLSLKTEHSKHNKNIDEKVVKDLNVQVVEEETSGNSSSDNLMRQQTPQEQVAKVMIQGDVKFEKLQFETTKTVEIKPTEVSANKIIEQISKQLDGMYNNSKLNMVLNPGTLGKVNLQLVNAKDGLTAQFTVTTQEARDLLMKGISGLKDSLLSQGVSVDNISVKMEEQNEGDSSYDWTEQEGSRGGNKHQGSQKQQKEQEKPFEQMMFELNNDGRV